jgi:pimeloyl-ACP methyl ester carboxylesterase
MRMRLPVLLVGVLVFLCLNAPFARSQTKAVVVSTNPANGATGVDPFLASFSITFSKPMDTTRCGASTRSWPYPPSGQGGSCTWSADKLTMTLTRYNPETPFAAGLKIEAYLVDPEWKPQESYLLDAQGNHIDPYYYSFTILQHITGILKIPADSSKGFEWPYYLYIPAFVKVPTVLLVEPNNTGTTNDDPAVHDAAASSLINSHKYRADDLGSPFLMPTFPRPYTNWKVYTQALDRDALTTSLPGLSRIDLQLVAMIDDARARLAAMGINAGLKAWMVGYSASGSFVNRFTILHPDRVQAMSAGSGGEYAIAPVSVWKGRTLRYPVGVADLQQLVGQPFDKVAFSKVPVQIYIGDQQADDAINYTDGYDPDDAALIKEVFGGPTFRRYPASEAAYNSIGSPSQFVIFPGVGHVWPDWSFISEFLERNRTEPFPPPLPKPLLYPLYFPHVASFDQWETEIALTSTDEVPVRGELRAYTADGGDPIESLPITTPAGGRVEITVGKSFQQPQQIAYLEFLSDSGFLAGYTRFYQPGNRVSLALGTGNNYGWFPKVEKDGWTGVAFLNVGTVAASVRLTAWDDNGNQVAETTLSLQPGEKRVGMVTQLFQSDLKEATYCRYSSDSKLLGFTVSGSSDGQMLDGLHALGDYISAKK